MISFILMYDGTGGVPELNLANAGDNCTTFPGTALYDCPQIALVQKSSLSEEISVIPDNSQLETISRRASPWERPFSSQLVVQRIPKAVSAAALPQQLVQTRSGRCLDP
jgi:hypothetical protein